MLIGNGVSIAFSDNLLLKNITTQVIARITQKYGGRGDEVAQAMQKIAIRTRADNPAEDFESLIGAFGGQTDILDDLRSYALLTEEGYGIAQAISEVIHFVQGVRQRGIGHTLETIVDNSTPNKGSFASLSIFLRTAIDAFPGSVSIANLNYDALVLSALTTDYKDEFCDMGVGWGAYTETNLGKTPYTAHRLRSKIDFPSSKRIKLLDLHGSVTFWKIGSHYSKIPLEVAREQDVWESYRSMQTEAFPLVVLANQHDKIDHVKRHPFKLAYEAAEIDFRSSENWIVAGYSFRDTCVNDLLRRCWEARDKKPNPVRYERPRTYRFRHRNCIQLGSGKSA
ncbi:hypothetical protein D2E70_08765 [Mycobacteroides abscessus]|nr:hypothetical protein D2E70_08765 [Mycobacteroides abscessus]